jgi:hypothetical protein
MGQKGATGPTGAAGPTGATGPTGPGGALLYEFNAVAPTGLFIPSGGINPFPFPRDTTLSMTSTPGSSQYNSTSSTYTAPVSGDYLFSTTIILQQPIGTTGIASTTVGTSTVSYPNVDIQFILTPAAGTPGTGPGVPAVPVTVNYPVTYTLVSDSTNFGGSNNFTNTGIDSHTISQIIPMEAGESINVALALAPNVPSGALYAVAGSTFQGGLVSK